MANGIENEIAEAIDRVSVVAWIGVTGQISMIEEKVAAEDGMGPSPEEMNDLIDRAGGTEAAKRMTEDLVVIAQKTCDRVAVVGAADACARTAERLETEQMAMSLARGRAQLQTNEARKMKVSVQRA